MLRAMQSLPHNNNVSIWYACLIFPVISLFGCRDRGPVPIVGTLERHRIEVAATASEQVASLSVREGDRVTIGQVLAQLDDSAQRAQRQALAAELTRARQQLLELQHGARPEERTITASRLSAAQADYARAQKDFDRSRELATRGLIATAQLDEQQRARDSAAAALRGAQADVQLQRSGTRAEQIQQAEAAVAAAEAQLAQQDVLLQRLQLKAPVDGDVESIPYRVGERPPLGAPVIVLLASGAPYARVYIPESHRAQVRAGTTVRVRIDGVNTTFSGTVRYVSAEASFTPYFALTQRDRSRLVYVAEIDVADAAARDLPAGVPLEVTLGGAP